jgi:hypothetical protein
MNVTGDTGFERAIALYTVGASGDRTGFVALAEATVAEGLGPETLFALCGYVGGLLDSLTKVTGVPAEALLRAVALEVARWSTDDADADDDDDDENYERRDAR